MPPMREMRHALLGMLLLAVLAGIGCEAGSEEPTYRQAILQHRMELDMDMRERGSVLPSDMRDEFKGLDYFDVDSTYRFEAPFSELSTPDTMMMPVSTGGAAPQVKVGYVAVPFPEGEAQLAVFRGAPESGRQRYWIPFADETNGSETYKAGRYVDVELGEDGRAVVDFNRAYNPTCAYNPDYVCPLPPSENRLALNVRAGEKKPMLHAESQ